MASDSISSETKELELALRNLQPADLDDSFLDRLESAADGSIGEFTEAEIRFERSLRDHAPAGLDVDFLVRLESVVADVAFPVDDKIVLFPKTAPVAKPARRNRPMWAAAAAVALFGGFSALMIPQHRASAPVASGNGSAPPPASTPSNYVPAGFNTETDTEDVGVTWHPSGVPHRVFRLTYRDRTTWKNAEGKTIEVEQPRTEYIVLPEKMD